MHRKLVINEALHETRVALLEDGNIVELFIERGDESDIAGNSPEQIWSGFVDEIAADGSSITVAGDFVASLRP